MTSYLCQFPASKQARVKDREGRSEQKMSRSTLAFVTGNHNKLKEVSTPRKSSWSTHWEQSIYSTKKRPSVHVVHFQYPHDIHTCVVGITQNFSCSNTLKLYVLSNSNRFGAIVKTDCKQDCKLYSELYCLNPDSIVPGRHFEYVAWQTNRVTRQKRMATTRAYGS